MIGLGASIAAQLVFKGGFVVGNLIGCVLAGVDHARAAIV